MNATAHRTSGFTIVEVLISSSILLLVLAAAISGYVHMLQGLHGSDCQAQLDTDVQRSIEHLKRNMHLSSLDAMLFYPDGAGPYTAISFPMARDDDGDGAVDKDEDNRIIWDKTVIYHVWEESPSQLRCTVIDPRDPNMSDADRMAQLASVVTTGDASAAPGGQNGKTTVVFENLFNWTITPRGSIYDGYAPELTLATGANLGTCVLDDGPHVFRFTVIGKNSKSSGYGIGIDSLNVSPSYSRREGEDQLPCYSQSGAMAERMYMPQGSWSGNGQLWFPATASDNYFELVMDNDLWCETSFDSSGDAHDNTRTKFDTSTDPRIFVVEMVGCETNWLAADQTGSPVGTSRALSGDLSGAAFRTLIRGEEMVGGNWLTHSGERCKVAFRAGTSSELRIKAAYIAEAASSTSNTMDTVAGTSRALLFGGFSEVTIPMGTEVWSDLTDLVINKERSYSVTCLFSTSIAGTSAWSWPDVVNQGNIAGAFIPGSSNPGFGDASATNWSQRADLIWTNAILAVAKLYATYPQRGSYVSSIFDTHVDDPSYAEILWDAQVPAGSDISLKVRTGDEPDLADAQAWTNVPSIPVYGIVNVGEGRYVQFRSELSSDSTHLKTPQLKGAQIRWHGQESAVDIVGAFTKNKDCGIFSVSVDGKPIVMGVNIDLEIFSTVRMYGETKTIRSAISAEINPRNSGL